MPAKKRYNTQIVMPVTIEQKTFCEHQAEKLGINLSIYMRKLIDAEIERVSLVNQAIQDKRDN